MLDGAKGATKNFLSKHKKLSLFAIILILIIIASCIILIFFLPSRPFVSPLPTCGDGTFYNSCSLDKPYYCYGGTLIANVLSCGCPNSLTRQGSSCISQYQSSPESINFSYIFDGVNGTIGLSLYGGLVTYLSTLPQTITYTGGQQPLLSDFKLMRIDEPNQDALITPLVVDIENLAPNDKVNQARVAISLVQNIPWGSSGKTVQFAGTSVGYSRYPYEVLYDNQGLCGEKSELLAAILKDLGYGVALFYYPQENHEAVGIKCPTQYSLGGTGYCFVETSGPAIISDRSLVYSNGITLSSSPQTIILSDGISLPDGLYEYNDARTLSNIMSSGNLDPTSSYEFKQLEAKYGLSKVYNIT